MVKQNLENESEKVIVNKDNIHEIDQKFLQPYIDSQIKGSSIQKSLKDILIECNLGKRTFLKLIKRKKSGEPLIQEANPKHVKLDDKIIKTIDETIETMRKSNKDISARNLVKLFKLKNIDIGKTAIIKYYKIKSYTKPQSTKTIKNVYYKKTEQRKK
jgi:hypothetical protein